MFPLIKKQTPPNILFSEKPAWPSSSGRIRSINISSSVTVPLARTSLQHRRGASSRSSLFDLGTFYFLLGGGGGGIRFSSAKGLRRDTPLLRFGFPRIAGLRRSIFRLQKATSSWAEEGVVLAWSPSQVWEKHRPERLLESRAAAELLGGAAVLADVSFGQSLLSESVAIGKNSIISTSEAGISICETPAIGWRSSSSNHSHSSIRKC